MIWKNIFAGSAFLVLLVVHVPCCSATVNNHSCANPSSCGNLTNVVYPFRLKDDPQDCGDPSFELVCQDNQTLILHLFSGKYSVKAINYSDSTIRVADVGVRDGNCSSLPLHTLDVGNFSTLPEPYKLLTVNSILFVSCEKLQQSPLYVDAAACIRRETSSLPTKKKYPYVLLDDLASNLGDSCDIDLIVPSNLPLLMNYKNFTFTDIHKDLADGFDLNWNSMFRWKKCSGNEAGRPLGNTTQIDCSSSCSFTKISSFKCLANLLGQVALMTTVVVYRLAIYGTLPYNITILAIFVIVRFICGAPFFLVFLIYKWRRRHLSMYDSIEEFLQEHNNLTPIRYSYLEIKKMTNNFKDKLGEGGYGSVYKGKLRSGYLVAVKMLGKSTAIGQEFISEVATIGRIHHCNVVRLIGFCAEGPKQALIYDFMPNGSLDKYIFSPQGSTSLSWATKYEISLGVAQGIEYLHRGCDMQILHFDIKPHNILLDQNFIPKVSDFGLAKLYPAKGTIVSLTAARGTIGYIAPELVYKNLGGVSYKADVYSFGMLLMEMAGKRNHNSMAEGSSQISFPFDVHEQIANGKGMETDEATEEEKRIVKKMVTVALWCIQILPSDRPPMNKVVEMLEGEPESLELPPKSSLCPEETLKEDDGDQTYLSSASMESTESISLIASMV